MAEPDDVLAESRNYFRQQLLRPQGARYRTPKFAIAQDLVDADYVLAIDDSGSSDAMFTKKGRPVLKNDFWAIIYCFGLHKSYLEDFNAHWIDLQETIREKLRIADLPPLHVMWMYGRTVKETYGSKRNPYYGVPLERRLEWVHAAAAIVNFYGTFQEACFERSYAVGREVILETFYDTMELCKMWSDINYLGASKNPKPYRLMLQRLSNPFAHLLPRMLGLINLSMQFVGNKRTAILFDSFYGTESISAEGVKTTVNDTLGLRNIALLRHMKPSENAPILQAADLMAFWSRRIRQGVDREIALDQQLPIINVHKKEEFHIANEVWKREPLADDTRAWLVLQYSIFFEYVKEVAQHFYNALVDPALFAERIEENKQTGKRVSIFKDAAVSEGFSTNKLIY